MTAPPADRAPSLLAQLLRRIPRGPRVAWGYTPAFLLLAATPLATAIVVQATASIEAGRNRALVRAAAPALRAADLATQQQAARQASAPTLTAPTISDITERVAHVLPADARVGRMLVDAKGRIVLDIDGPDPDALRQALAADPLLARLRMTGQGVAGRDGVRVSFAGAGRG